MLRFCPDKEKLVSEIKDLMKQRKEGKKVQGNIKTFFAHQDAKGPVSIEKEVRMDYFIRNIRQDTFERITQLIN